MASRSFAVVFLAISDVVFAGLKVHIKDDFVASC